MFGAGVFGAVQPKINAVLGTRVGSAVLASLVNFGAAMTVVLVALALRPTTRRTLSEIRSWPVPRWMLLAGLGGASVVLAGAVAVETITVAVFSVAFFAGQITAGLLVDRTGIGAGGARPIVAARVYAALIAIAAVAVSQLGQPVGAFAPGVVAVVVAAGAGSAFQAAFNGRITRSVGDPVAATAVNVTVGLVALACVVGVLAMLGRFDSFRWPTAPWLYCGGLLGVTIVLSLAVATAALGVLRATLAMLAAQLVTAIGVDWVVEHEPPRAGVLAGAGLIVVAVFIVGRTRTAAVT